MDRDTFQSLVTAKLIGEIYADVSWIPFMIPEPMEVLHVYYYGITVQMPIGMEAIQDGDITLVYRVFKEVLLMIRTQIDEREKQEREKFDADRQRAFTSYGRTPDGIAGE